MNVIRQTQQCLHTLEMEFDTAFSDYLKIMSNLSKNKTILDLESYLSNRTNKANPRLPFGLFGGQIYKVWPNWNSFGY